MYVGFVMCGCFHNTCTCIYCVLYCLYCVFVLVRLCMFILICFVSHCATSQKVAGPIPDGVIGVFH